MKTRTVVILFLVALAAVVVFQNSQLTTLRLAFWSVYAPQFILVLIVFIIGFMAGYLAGRRGRRKDDRAADRPAPAAPPARPAPKP